MDWMYKHLDNHFSSQDNWFSKIQFFFPPALLDSKAKMLTIFFCSWPWSCDSSSRPVTDWMRLLKVDTMMDWMFHVKLSCIVYLPTISGLSWKCDELRSHVQFFSRSVLYHLNVKHRPPASWLGAGWSWRPAMMVTQHILQRVGEPTKMQASNPAHIAAPDGHSELVNIPDGQISEAAKTRHDQATLGWLLWVVPPTAVMHTKLFQYNFWNLQWNLQWSFTESGNLQYPSLRHVCHQYLTKHETDSQSKPVSKCHHKQESGLQLVNLIIKWQNTIALHIFRW